jgi:hypothetical protein
MMARMRMSRCGGGTIVLATLATTVLAGCSLRLDTPPIPAPSPSQYELLRDAAARAEAHVLDALPTTAGETTPGREYFVQVEAASANAHLDALGGVYVPFPVATPTPSTTPSPSAVPEPARDVSSLTRAVAEARDGDLAAALIADDADLALVLASIGLSHAEALAVGTYQDAIAAGSAPLASERHMPGVAFSELVPASTALDATTLEGIIVAHDFAAYAYEVIAARSSDNARAQALERSRIHAHRAAELVAIEGADPRSPAYVIDHARLDGDASMAALAHETEAGIADRYITAFFGAAQAGPTGLGDRGWLLAGAYDALVQGPLWSGATAADADPLPGVVLPSG